MKPTTHHRRSEELIASSRTIFWMGGKMMQSQKLHHAAHATHAAHITATHCWCVIFRQFSNHAISR